MSFPAAILAATPTTYYAFSGDDPLNVTGTGPRPSAVSGPTFSRTLYPVVDGVVPGAVGFDPTRLSYLDFGNRGLDAFISGKAAVTFLATVYIAAYSATQSTILSKIISTGSVGAALSVNSAGALVINGRSRAADANQSATSASGSVATGGWALLVGELNFTAKTIRGWVNDTLVVNATGVSGFGQNTYTQSSTTASDMLGAAAAPGAAVHLNGRIAHLALFDKALNDTQRGDIFSAWLDRPSVSGIVYDDTGAPAARTVRLIDRASGRLLGETTSDGVTGAYTLAAPGTAEAQVVFLDDSGGTTYNDKILRVVPA